MTPKHPGGRPRLAPTTVDIQVRLPADAYAKLDRRAAAMGHRCAAYVRWVLLQHLDDATLHPECEERAAA